MSYVNQHNFDWSITNREIVIFIPNFNRKHLIIPTLVRWQTSLPKNDWLILVVNDGAHEDLSDLEQYNVKYFTFERDPGERNGCMIRNYIIKRIQSRLLMSKDPEIILYSKDCLENTVQCRYEACRAGRAIELMEFDVQKILKNDDLDVFKLKHKREYPVQTACHEGFHFCYTASTKLLRELSGYDETFVQGYGWEDVDILRRLEKNSHVKLDNSICAMHIWHPRRAKFLKTVIDNGAIYQNIVNNDLVTNEGVAWGNG